MQPTPSQEPMIPCPGCGGRGHFAWGANPKVPKRWTTSAPCGMCQGSGTIPTSWLHGKKSTR